MQVIKNNGDFKLNEINELFKGIRFNLIMAENEDVEEAIEIYQQKNHCCNRNRKRKS